MIFGLFRRPTVADTHRSWAREAQCSAQDHRYRALTMIAQAELLMARAKGEDTIAEMYEERARRFLESARQTGRGEGTPQAEKHVQTAAIAQVAV